MDGLTTNRSSQQTISKLKVKIPIKLKLSRNPPFAEGLISRQEIEIDQQES
mgnify:CR=1 FL=1